MWQLIDATRVERRRNQLAFQEDVHQSMLQRQKHPAFLPCANEEKYARLGGETGRTMIVGWIFKQGSENHLKHATCFQAVSYLERVLTKTRITLRNAQQFAETCLYIAIKMEEVGGDSMDLPRLECGELNEAVEVLALRLLDWNLIAPTAYTFAKFYAEQIWLPEKGRSSSVHYLRSILMHKESQLFLPSSLALVSILLLERDGLLPGACKKLVQDIVVKHKNGAPQIADGFLQFREKCPPIKLMDTLAFEVVTESSDSDCSSTTTAYPQSTDSSLEADLHLGSDSEDTMDS